MNWQPIETAPKDGTQILVWDGNNFNVSWYGYPSVSERYKAFIYGEAVGDYNCFSEVYEPTHWMPLPEPPQSLSANASADSL